MKENNLNHWHLTFSSVTRHSIFASESLRRASLRKIAVVASAALQLYSLVDDHLHLALKCSRQRAGRIQQAMTLALQPLAAADISSDLRPVTGRSHLLWLVRYFLLQVEKHGLDEQPALWMGSCFQDMIGARCMIPIWPRLRDVLPRFHLEQAIDIVGLPRRPTPASDSLIFHLGAVRLVEAVCVSQLTGPRQSDRSEPAIRARCIACRLARAAGLPLSEVSRCLGISERTARRCANSPVNPTAVLAVRIRLALEEMKPAHVAGIRNTVADPRS